MTSVKDSVEYRLAILEQQVNVLQLQQDDLKQLGKELNSLIHKTQMYELSLSDMKERLEDHKQTMKSLKDEIKMERTEFLAAQREAQRENAERMEKIQVSLLKKLDDVDTKADEIKLYHHAQQVKETATKKEKTLLNLSDGTIQTILRLIIALIGIVAGIYGIKLI